MDYPFQIACVQPPSPLRKNRRRGVCGGGGRLYRPVHGLVSDGQSISSSSVKTANNKMPVSSVFNDSEALYRTTVSVALSVGLIIPRGTVRFDVQGLGLAMSTVASEKNNLESLFTGNVFYKQWHLCVLFH